MRIFKVHSSNGVVKYFSDKRLANSAAKAYSAVYERKFVVTSLPIREAIDPEIVEAYHLKKREAVLKRKEEAASQTKVCTSCHKERKGNKFYMASNGRSRSVCAYCMSEEYHAKKQLKES